MKIKFSWGWGNYSVPWHYPVRKISFLLVGNAQKLDSAKIEKTKHSF